MSDILKRQGMGLVALMVALVIIALMCFFALRSVKKSEEATTNQKFIKEAGVDTSSYKGILDSTKKTLKDAEATRGQIP